MTGHAYPWDLLGDPGFIERVAGLGIDEVTLAAHYHSVRAATPQHPHHQVVTAPHAAFHRPVRSEAWEGRRLAPVTADWIDDPDSFATGASALRGAGMRVNAWIVLTHNTRLGEANPDLAVVNCFGDRYPYALCPQHDEVRDYSALLAAESLRDLDVDGVLLEAWGQLGVVHDGHHEKTAQAWSATAERLLSVCCCAACRRDWTAVGLDETEVVDELRRAVRAVAAGGEAELPDGLELMLAVIRTTAAARNLTGIVAAVGTAAPGTRVMVHAHPSDWSMAPLSAVALTENVDVVQVSAWETGADAATDVAAAVDAAPDGVAVAAYVSVLPPATADQLDEHVARIAEAGAAELHLYHLGLAPLRLMERMRGLIARFRAASPAG